MKTEDKERAELIAVVKALFDIAKWADKCIGLDSYQRRQLRRAQKVLAKLAENKSA